ncbi:MAG: hypothetical protein QM750_09235 [Rubrivivax sp.]
MRIVRRPMRTRRRRAARPATKLQPRGVLWGAVLTTLSWKWSPQQIAATLRRVFPDDPCRHVSHETIYTAIYARFERGFRQTDQYGTCISQR